MNGFAPKYVDRPREGFFKIRAFRAGPWIPVRFYRDVPLDPATGELLDRWPRLAAERDDVVIDEHSKLLDLWPWCREITRGEWQWIKTVTWPLMKRRR